MRLVYVCEEEEREIGRHQAPGRCPNCGGKVQAVEVEGTGKFCYFTVCFRIKRKYVCTLCFKRLVLYSHAII
ncbi:uncharacterized protein [Primulina eburnea]|uniref:uncharacterized protein n=1 Tax=Primulina eburnea TaxID=1245227 RepID=UPI003C6CC22E